MQECRETNWPGRRRANTPRDVHWYPELACMGWCEHAWTYVRCASDHAERCAPARKGWHNSLVVRIGWPGWMAPGHGTSRHGEVKTAGILPAKVGTARLSCRTW
ncbi:hypothetical protein CDL15_Pgr026314 [Punica granatum]|nr:hypothetical protein CDL15_Pgr026314 [Punica granatum]